MHARGDEPPPAAAADGLRVLPYAEADAARWDEFVTAHPASHFAQLAGWKRLVEESYGCPGRYWLAEEGGRIRGVLPLFERPGRALFSAPGGLLAEDEAVAAALLEPARRHLERLDLDWIELRDQAVVWASLLDNPEHCTLALDLAPDPDTQWSRFDAKLRNLIRKGEKSGFRARFGREHLADFHRVMLENMRDLGTPIRGRDYYRRTLEALGPRAELLVLDLDGEPASAMFLVAHRDTAFDPWASSRRRFFARNPNMVLYWHALRWAIGRGLSRFDFGRSQWNSGTFQFKRQWGARPVPLHYQYALHRAARMPTLADQKRTLELAVKVWRRLPLPVAAALGERVKRMFPEVL